MLCYVISGAAVLRFWPSNHNRPANVNVICRNAYYVDLKETVCTLRGVSSAFISKYYILVEST